MNVSHNNVEFMLSWRKANDWVKKMILQVNQQMTKWEKNRQSTIEGLRATMCYVWNWHFEKRGIECFYIGNLYKNWQVAKWWNYYDHIDYIASFKFKTWIRYHLALCHNFWRNMLCLLNTLLHGALHLLPIHHVL